MATQITAANAIDPVLTGLFRDFGDETRYVGSIIAPFREIDGISGQYTLPKNKYEYSEDPSDTEFDDLRPHSPDDESTPTGVEFETASVTLEHYSKHVFVNDLYRAHWMASANFDVVQPALRQLHAIVSGIHERKVGLFVEDNANFGATSDPGDFSTSSTDDIFRPLDEYAEDIADEIGRRPNIVIANPDTIRYLVSENDDFRKSIALDTEDQLAAPSAADRWFRDYLGCRLVVMAGAYTDSSGNRVKFLGDNDIAIAYVSANDGDPSWCNTFVNSQVGTGIGQEAGTAGVITEEKFDPPGTKFIARNSFKIKTDRTGAARKLTDVLS